MDAFMTVKPMYTAVISGNEISASRYEQICTYDAANGKYVCRFADLLEYSYAKPGQTYKGLTNDGDLVITIPFKLKSGVAAGSQVAFSATNAKGTTTAGLNSTSTSNASAVYSVPSAAADYYLVGYINGANYGCEGDYANLGKYKFVNGKLTTTFETDSYVFVKTGDNANWYMAQSYIQTTSGTMYNTNTGTSEKMFVPGGKEVTFTLVKNSDGSITLSYVVGSGATAAVPTLTGSSFSLSFESEILVNFYYTASNMQDVVEQGMLVFYNNPGNAAYAKADEVYTGATSSGNYYLNTTKGIPAKYMGDSRYYAAYAKLSDGTFAYSKLYQYSPKKYATNMLGKSNTSAEQKALCVAMLNYGAAAQKYFGYKTNDLMNAGLTAEQKAMVVPYNASLFKGAVAATASKTVNFPKNASAFASRSATVSFDGAFAINYYFAPSANVSGNMKMYYWTPEAYAAASTLTVNNASGSVVMVPSGDGSYWGQVSGIAAKYLDETYYVAGVYTDTNGNTYCTGVIAYSLSRYCLNNAKDGNAMQELAANTAMYGYYAKAYFANK
jgi:hypothetical protein